MPLIPKSRFGPVLIAILAAILTIVVVLIGSPGWLDAFGSEPTGERLARIRRSPDYRDGAFRNPEATRLGTSGSTWKTIRHWLGGHEQRVPPSPMPIVSLTTADFAEPPASGLRATSVGRRCWSRSMARVFSSTLCGRVARHRPPWLARSVSTSRRWRLTIFHRSTRLSRRTITTIISTAAWCAR